MGTKLTPEIVPLSSQGIGGAATPYIRTTVPNQGAGAGNLALAGADILSVFAAAEAETQLAEHLADTTKRLNSLAGELDFETEPTSVQEKWAQGVTALKQEYEQNLGTNSTMYQTWNKHFLDTSTRLGIGIEQKQRGLIVDKGMAALTKELDAERDGLSLATTAEEYAQAKERGVSAIMRKVDAGILSAADGEAKRVAWEDNLDKILEEKEYESRIQNTYSFLRDNFPERDDAVGFLEDPANQKKLGLNLKEALYFIDVFDAAHKRDLEDAEEKKQAAAKREGEQFYQLVREKDYAGATGFLARAQFLDEADKLRMGDALKSRQWQDDPALVAQLRSGVWTRRITDKGELLKHLGNGLSAQTMDTLREDIDTLTPEAEPVAGDGINYFDLAVQRFRKQFKDAPGALEQEARFVASLTHMARQEKVNPESPAITKLADDLLAPYEEKDGGWFGMWDKEHSSRFEYMLEQDAFEYDDGQGSAPAPDPTPAQRVPAAAYNLIKEQLEAAGSDTSDGTIYKVYVANIDKFKGAE